jgi:hypothetical protein
MVKPLNKEWKLFGHKYRVVGAKGEKVDCKACQKQVSAAVNRLQSHMRVCPARSSLATALLNSSGTSSSTAENANTGLSEAIAHAIEADSLATEQAMTVTPSLAESNAPPVKKLRQSPARPRDRPRWNASTGSAASAINEDDLWLNSIVGGPVSSSQPVATSSFNKRRLEIEEKRLQLEMKRDEREERREKLNLEIMEAQARKERLLMEKEAYAAKVLLALSRKQLRDQGVSEEEIDRILPIENSQTTASNASEAVVVTTAEITIEKDPASTSSEAEADSSAML